MENQDKENLTECEKPNWFQRLKDRLIAFFSKNKHSENAEKKEISS